MDTKRMWLLVCLLSFLALPLRAGVTGITPCTFDKKGTINILPVYTVSTNTKTGKVLTDKEHIPQVSEFRNMVRNAESAKEWTQCAYVAGLLNYWSLFPSTKKNLTRDQKIEIIQRTYDVMHYMAAHNYDHQKKYIKFYEYLSAIRRPLCTELGVCNGNESIRQEGDDLKIIVYREAAKKVEESQQSGVGTTANEGECGGQGGEGGGGFGDGEGSGVGFGTTIQYRKCFI